MLDARSRSADPRQRLHPNPQPPRRAERTLTPALSRKRERERRRRQRPSSPLARARGVASRGRRRRVHRRARVAVGAQVRARARRRPCEGDGHRAERAHPAGGRAGLREGRHDGAAAAAAAASGGGPRSPAVAEGRLREVRADRNGAAVADQEDLRRQSRAQLGDDPARHAVRRGRHHGPRGAARHAQQGEREGGHQGDDARVPHQGVGVGA